MLIDGKGGVFGLSLFYWGFFGDASELILGLIFKYFFVNAKPWFSNKIDSILELLKWNADLFCLKGNLLHYFSG